MKQLRNIVAPIFLLCLMLVAGLPVFAQTQEDVTPQEQKENTVDVKEIVFGHIGDSYEWHITTWGKTHITIPLRWCARLPCSVDAATPSLPLPFWSPGYR